MLISIVANQMEEFQARLTKLSKRLKLEIPWCPSRFYKMSQPVNGESIDVVFVEIDVELDSIFSVNGFKFFALVKNEAGVPLIFSADPEAFKKLNTDQSFKCPHCNKVIPHRKNKIFLKNDKNEIVAFGSSCAQQYFGSSYKILARGIDHIQELKDWATSGPTLTTGYNDVIRHSQMVDCAIFGHLRGEKFVSNKDAEYNYCRSSSDLAYSRSVEFFANQLNVDTSMHEKEIPDFQKLKSQIAEIKEKIYSFYSTFVPVNNFEENLKTHFERRGMHSAILTYGVFKYVWTMEKLAKEAAPKKVWKDSEFVQGQEVKDLEVTFVRQNSFATNYGDVSFYNFTDLQGAVIVVRVTGSLDHLENNTNNFSLTIGKHYIIKKAVVKEKKNYKDIPQTILKLGRKNNIVEK